MRTYKYGSRSMDHEENLTVPDLHWLGVKINDVLGSEGVSVVGGDGCQPSASQSSQLSQSSAGHFSSQGSDGIQLPGKPIPEILPIISWWPATSWLTLSQRLRSPASISSADSLEILQTRCLQCQSTIGRQLRESWYACLPRMKNSTTRRLSNC